MSRLLNMRIEARAEMLARMEEIHEKAADEDGRELTEEEERELEELRSRMDEMDKRIASLEGDSERSKNAPQPRSIPKVDLDANGKPLVNVRSEPGPYGDGTAGLRRMLIDAAAVDIGYRSTDPDFKMANIIDRQEKWATHIRNHENADINARAVAMTNLGGIVNPQFDPTTISRGVYDAGVTAMLCNRYPMFSEGDSITMPRVSTTAASAIQTEGSDANDTSPRTTAIKADLFTIAAKTEVSVQSIERGVMSLELLQDELRRSWIDQLNHQVLYGTGATGNPQGMLDDNTSINNQRIQKTDASETAIKQLGYLTDAKTAVFKAGRRRPTAYIVGPDTMGDWENAQTNGIYVLPPYGAWAQNVGGAGTLPEVEGPMSEAEWRRVPIFVDAAIGDTFTNGHARTGGTQSRYIAMVRSDMPIFFDGPMSFAFEQTLAASLEVLLVVRGYAAWNFLWRPEAWRIIYGSGTDGL